MNTPAEPEHPRRAGIARRLWLPLVAGLVLYGMDLFRQLVVPGAVLDYFPDLLGTVGALRLIQDTLWSAGLALLVAVSLIAAAKVRAKHTGALALSRLPSVGYRIGLIVVVLAAVGLNVAVDPYHVYGTERFPPRLKNHVQPKLQAYTQRQRPPDVLLLGSSRMIRFRPDYVAEQFKVDAFNLAMEDFNARDILPLLQYVAAQPGGAPPVVMIELAEDGEFMKEPTLLFAPPALLPHMPLLLQIDYMERRIEAGLSAAALSESLYTLWYTKRIGPPPPPIPILENGGMNAEERNSEVQFSVLLQRSILRGESEREQRAPYASINGNGEPCSRIAASLFTELNAVIGWAEQQHSAIIILITPHYPAYTNEVGNQDPVMLSCRHLLDQYMQAQTRQHQLLFYLPLRTLESIGGIATNAGFLDGTHLTAYNSERLVDVSAETVRKAISAAFSARQKPVPNKLPPLPHEVMLRFDGSAHTRGWYLPEGYPTPFQWLGPDPSGEVEVRIDTSAALEVSFCVQTVIAPQVLTTLQVSANGIPVVLTSTSATICPMLYRAMLPRSILARHNSKADAVKLTFNVERTISPQDIILSRPDPRQLGIALSWLSLTQPRTRIDFDGSWKAMNLYPPERDEKGVPYQWFGPLPRTRLELPVLEDAPLRLTLCGQAAVSPDVLASLRLFANDQPIDLKSDTISGCPLAYQASLPMSVLARQADLVTLDLVVDRTVTPAGINTRSTDTRFLGIALKWLSVESVSP